MRIVQIAVRNESRLRVRLAKRFEKPNIRYLEIKIEWKRPSLVVL